MMLRLSKITVLTLSLAVAVAACGGKKKPVALPTAPPQVVQDVPPVTPQPEQRPPAPPAPPPMPEPVMQPLPSDDIATKDLDTINKAQVLKPIFFQYDSDQIDAAGQQVLVENAAALKKYTTWIITIEGHCDERGTPEYNLALGERRALSTKNALAALGISADRVKTVSYGKEFPFDPGHDEAAFSLNRRAHFVVTAKQ
ncbi:MAG: OmpA family protein [Acidobacteria bacterium]|nr:MAG: OmpA family protein [Acidobacteriota bacterium]